ncbi:MAG: alpha/beta fold hydrolase [Candidatus Nitrosopolaris sp.]
MRLPLGLFLIGILTLSCLSAGIFKQQGQALAQQYIQTIKYRNLVIDLGNGVKTNAQLTFPAIGKGPFPGVLLIHGSGAHDKNETLGYVHKGGAQPAKAFWQIAQYLSERGFAVLRYDKRGVGANKTILNSNLWGNLTANQLKQDAEKALNILIQQLVVDPKKITLIGHSEGTIIVPRVTIDNPTRVKNIVLMGTVAQNLSDILHFQNVDEPLLLAKQVLDRDHDGILLLSEVASRLNGSSPDAAKKEAANSLVEKDNKTGQYIWRPGLDADKDGAVSIDKELKPLLENAFESLAAFPSGKCTSLEPCRTWVRSVFALQPNLSVVGNLSSTNILILNGENDSQTPVQQAFLLQQRLTEANYPDHTLITYPNLGHAFYPSSQWSTGIGPIEPYVLADLYSWLEFHSGFTNSTTKA